MTTDSIDNSLVPPMHAEAGFELEDSAPPLRVSGFICLLFGLLSVLCVIGQPLLVLPVITIVFGMIALRRSDGQRPIGTRPALVGLVLAAGFGACGLFLPLMKSMTLGSQAERFSKYYIEVVARGHDEFAMELRKDHVNRFPTTMPLQEHYRLSETARQSLEEFKQESVTGLIRDRGPNAEWVLDRPTRVYYSYGREHAEVVWADPTDPNKPKLQMFLEYRTDTNGDGQWHIDVVQTYRELIVAESIL